LFPGNFPDYAGQVGHLGEGPHAQDRRFILLGLAHEARNHAGDDGARGLDAAHGTASVVDDVYLGGVREGEKACRAEGMMPFVAAL